MSACWGHRRALSGPPGACSRSGTVAALAGEWQFERAAVHRLAADGRAVAVTPFGGVVWRLPGGCSLDVESGTPVARDPRVSRVPARVTTDARKLTGHL